MIIDADGIAVPVLRLDDGKPLGSCSVCGGTDWFKCREHFVKQSLEDDIKIRRLGNQLLDAAEAQSDLALRLSAAQRGLDAVKVAIGEAQQAICYYRDADLDAHDKTFDKLINAAYLALEALRNGPSTGG